MKKKQNASLNTEKRKRRKLSKPEPEKTERAKGEILNAQTIREGMLLLGCVIEIRTNCFLVSLPGCLVGNVAATDVSEQFTERIKHSVEDEAEEVSLNSIIQLGAVLPCKVLQVTKREKLKKPTIALSVDPRVVNGELRLQSLYLKMVLHSSVVSVEDHGYLMDIGVKNTQGFLPFSASNGNKDLAIGQIVPTSVRKLPSQKTGNVIWLSMLTFDEEFPEVEDESMKLTSILPGTNVVAYVTEVTHPFIYMKCMNFEACGNVMSLGASNSKISEGTKVSGTVLYIHPITHLIYLRLVSKPTPKNFENLFRVKKFDVIQKLKYEYLWYSRLFFRMPRGTMGFIKQGGAAKGNLSEEHFSKNSVLPKARAVFLHYMDNMVQLSINESFLNLEIVKPDEVSVGDVIEATVKKHMEGGMFVLVCPGLSGYVRQIHFSDSFSSMPVKLHPVGEKVKCRVLSMHPQSGLNLTCKESLVKIPPTDILQSYEQVQPGNSYKGVIVQKSETHLLILFFNDVKGIVPAENIPESVFFVGQTVTCQVLYCDPKKKKLRLSLMGDKSDSKKALNNVSKKSLKFTREVDDGSLTKDQLQPLKLRKAIIKSRTKHQLNILMNGGLMGRVHITQLRVTEERSRPLSQFQAGQSLKVHQFNVFGLRTKNFLEISHRRKHQYLECSLEYPPPAPIEREFYPGMSIMGYIKEVDSTSATLWLSPCQTGTLEYVNFSENPKKLRILKKKLKVGMSLNVSVLEVEQKSKSGYRNITLTRLENKVLKRDQNAVGLVQVASPEKGLIVKLSHGYHGSVCLTDLQDVYSSVLPVLLKLHRLSFIFCHVLEVNHSTKFCVLSLRMSRLYGLQDNTQKIQPEITLKDVGIGKSVKGLVKSKSNDHLIVNIGRMLDGQVPLHKCDTYGCSLCKQSQTILQKYSPGDVIDVVLDGDSPSKNLYLLSLPEFPALGSAQHGRLKVTEDIDWDEI